MPRVMDSGPAGDPGGGAGLPEGCQRDLVGERGSPLGHEERRGPGEAAGAEGVVVRERGDGGGVQREDPLAAGLGGPDGQQPGGQVDAAGGGGGGPPRTGPPAPDPT